MPTASLTSLFLLFLACTLRVAGAPLPSPEPNPSPDPNPNPSPNPNPQNSNQVNNAYTGAGGHAAGGSASTLQPAAGAPLGGEGLLDVLSGNGGGAGTAKSGAIKGGSGSVTIGSGSATTNDPTGGSGTTNNSVGNKYTGAAGVADGGAASSNGALLRVLSGNGGAGGDASSGLVETLSRLTSPGSAGSSKTRTRTGRPRFVKRKRVVKRGKWVDLD